MSVLLCYNQMVIPRFFPRLKSRSQAPAIFWADSETYLVDWVIYMVIIWLMMVKKNKYIYLVGG